MLLQTILEFWRSFSRKIHRNRGGLQNIATRGGICLLSNSDASNHIEGNGTVYIKRGDEIRLRGEFGIDSLSYNMATITRV